MTKTFAFLVLFVSGLWLDTPSIKQLRALFYDAANTQTAAESLAAEVATITENDKAVLICYKGASAMMDAKYKSNPINKLALFKKGKAHIEQAVRQEPKNIEIRFIRLTIQENLPSILGYNEHIENDREFLKKNLHHLKDKNLKKDISAYLTLRAKKKK